MPMTAELKLDKRKADRGLDQFEAKAVKTGKRVARALSQKGGVAASRMNATESAKIGIKAAGISGDKLDKFGKLSGAGPLALLTGAFGVVIQGVAAALEYFRQETLNTVGVMAENVKENKRVYSTMETRHKKELEAVNDLRRANQMRGTQNNVKMSIQADARDVLRRYDGLLDLTSLDESTGNLNGLDAVEKQLRERQRRELMENLARQRGEIERQLREMGMVIGRKGTVGNKKAVVKGDVNAAAGSVEALTAQLAEVIVRQNELNRLDIDKELDKRKQVEAANYLVSNVKPEKELEIEKQIGKLRISGQHEKADALEVELDLMRKQLDTNEYITEETRRQLAAQKALSRELQSDRWRQSEEDQVQAMREQIMTLAGRGKDASVSRALRDAERGKGSALTDEEKTQVRELAELNWQLSNMEKSGPGDIPGGTNELTARGGFASVGVSAADRVSQAIADNSAKTNALLNKIEQRLEKLEFVQ